MAIESGVYAIVCTVNDKIYVGSSCNLAMRKSQHFSLLKSGKHVNRHLQSSFNKHGFGNFSWKVLECCPAEKLIEREQAWINEYWNSGKMYNAEIGAALSGVARSEETRAKISKNLTGKKASEETLAKRKKTLSDPKIRAMMSERRMGKKSSEETKEKISLSLKGRKHSEGFFLKMKGRIVSEETRSKLSEKLKGRKHSPETLAKLAAANTPERRAAMSEKMKGRKHTKEAIDKLRGRKVSEETCLKISMSKKGYKPSEETRAKVSEKLKGRKFSEETLAKMALARKGYTHSRETRRKLSERMTPEKIKLATEAIVALNASKWPSGENNANAHLTWEKVREIRSRSSDSKALLSREFGVSSAHIRKIILGVAWKE